MSKIEHIMLLLKKLNFYFSTEIKEAYSFILPTCRQILTFKPKIKTQKEKIKNKN